MSVTSMSIKLYGEGPVKGVIKFLRGVWIEPIDVSDGPVNCPVGKCRTLRWH